MYQVYFLYSSSHKRFYVGVSSDLSERIHKHNRGWSKSTKPYAPWKLVYAESFEVKSGAYKREFYLKSPAGYLEKRKIIASISV